MKVRKESIILLLLLLNDEPGQFGDSGYIQTEQTKEERDAKASKVVFRKCKSSMDQWTKC